MYQTPFITDFEFTQLVSAEILPAITALAQDEGARQTCLSCGGRCCREIECGFFSREFSLCPIFEYRPAKCRFHFCPDLLYSDALADTTKQLLDLQFEKLSEVIKNEFLNQVFGSPQPPAAKGKAGLTGLDLERAAAKIISAMERREISPSIAQERLKDLVRRDREAQP